MGPDFRPLSPETVARIREAVAPATVIEDPAKKEPFGRDGTLDAFAMPELVVEATSAVQISALLKLANELRFPVTPRGLGTGLAGGAVPIHGGVLLSLAKMNRILAIDRDNFIAMVEPGVLNKDLKDAAREAGLYYPPDPASYDTCSIGGNAATNAGGPSCVKYGVTREYVLGLEAVLPTGELIRTGVRTRKGVVGYDLTRLLVGSEGTLGVITQLTLKLIPHPPAITTLVSLCPSLSVAMEAIRAVLGAGHIPCVVEFLDRHCLDLVGDLLPFEGVKDAGAFLLIETDGAPEIIAREIEAIGELCLGSGADQVLLAPDARRRERMWEVRKAVSLRIEERYPVDVHEDIVVPIRRIADFVRRLPPLEETYGMRIYTFGHAGDGNLHLSMTAETRESRERIDRGIEEILKRVLDMGGTISGEHGIGMMKSRYLPLELSPESIRLQRGIKSLFDPQGILNPGKVFPPLP
ncbi:MAG TPA: FAD-linked oxidase C-terminal domain-containing protein [Syntrophales bacterium]|nr:FAD-linked oxidase C-terminal domain-containing protein [Syntrophales bacterium]